MGRRYYSVSEGRFLQRDPIGYDGGINLYSFCSNNPIGQQDERGEGPVSIGCDKMKCIVDSARSRACQDIKNHYPKACSPTSNCMLALCKNGLHVNCGGAECKTHPKWCSYAGQGQFGRNGKCSVHLCPGIFTPLCFNVGINDVITSVEEAIIHEMAHCCGIGDTRPGGGGSNPADELACSCVGKGKPIPPYGDPSLPIH